MQDRHQWEDYSFSDQENKKTKIMYTMDAEEIVETLEGKEPFGDWILNAVYPYFLLAPETCMCSTESKQISKSKQTKRTRIDIIVSIKETECTCPFQPR